MLIQHKLIGRKIKCPVLAVSLLATTVSQINPSTLYSALCSFCTEYGFSIFATVIIYIIIYRQIYQFVLV